MLVLTSNGLSSDALLSEMRKRSRTKGKAALVTTASVGFKENDRHVPRLTDELKQLDYSVDYVDIETQDPRLLLSYDAVEILGGNPFYLLNQMRVQHCEGIFRELAERKILIGISAGSLVLQRNIELVAQYSPEMNDEVKLTDLSGLSLTSVEILPHYHRFLQKFDRFEERAREYERRTNYAVIRLDDGEGIFISDSGEPIIISTN